MRLCVVVDHLAPLRLAQLHWAWGCGWALRTCTRLPFWYSLLFFLLLLLSLSIAFWVWLWLVLTVIIAELPFPTRPFINKYLDRENSGVNEAANA